MAFAIVDFTAYPASTSDALDASIGLAEYHLGRAHCDPPVKKMIAGTDPLEVDRAAADLLGIDWQTVPHLR